jgi:bis(5'-nucleosyl)-tetraphosphatase (symmetrical)
VQRIFVGDIQGCADELEEILARARREYGKAYELWSVGDIVNRGPKSHRALALVREHVEAGRGQLVIGNHDLALLARWQGLRAPRPSDPMEDLLERPDLDEWCDWLRRRPLAVAGELGERGAPFLMVHASVHPRWSREETLAVAGGLEAQLGGDDRDALRRLLSARPDALGRIVSCRSVLPNDGWSKLPPELLAGAEPWYDAWRRHGPSYGIIYGHWSMQRLHVADRLRGLDTGCVHHHRDRDGFLTAWLPDGRRDDPFSLPDASFWQVRARRRYYRVTDEEFDEISLEGLHREE